VVLKDVIDAGCRGFGCTTVQVIIYMRVLGYASNAEAHGKPLEHVQH